MAFLTTNDVRSAVLDRGRTQALAGLRLTAKSDPSTEFDIFLSHSFQDAVTIAGIKLILERSGLKVYVDWIEDADLDRGRVSRRTAARLRSRMRHSRSLVFATSESSPKSKWMPWELGYFDGHKPGHVAILPLVDRRDSTFVGQEYLSLYPVVERIEGLGSGRLGVRRDSGSFLPIADFPNVAVRRRA